jgi:transcriptional regulator with XRE-family HTH domain
LAVEKLYREIGERIRALRQALKLTQAEVAEFSGIDASFYGQIERGANIPSLKTLLAIAAALKTSPADLLPPFTKPEHAHARAIDRVLEDLPEDKQRFILGLVKDIAGEIKNRPGR